MKGHGVQKLSSPQFTRSQTVVLVLHHVSFTRFQTHFCSGHDSSYDRIEVVTCTTEKSERNSALGAGLPLSPAPAMATLPKVADEEKESRYGYVFGVSGPGKLASIIVSK